MFSINFIAYAINIKNKNYEDFLIPFTFFSLLFNKNSHVEIIVLNPNKFKEKYKKEIESIKKINKNFLIRKPQCKLNRNIPNTYRFFETPTVKSKYTYISDIDIMYLEDIIIKYINTWPENLPYHNILRESDSSRLTGVMMVETEKYYTSIFKKCQEKYYNENKNDNDEKILAKMCKDIYGLPNLTFRYRPILGIHFSLNRGKNKKMELKTTKKYVYSFMSIVENYEELFKYEIFENLLNQIENFILT